MKKYEALFIFVCTIQEDKLADAITDASAEITKLGGTIESTDNLGRRQFEREMQKQTQGFYVKIRFDFDPSLIAQLKSRFVHNENVFRLQVVARDLRVENRKAKDNSRRSAFLARLAEQQAVAATVEATKTTADYEDDE